MGDGNAPGTELVLDASGAVVPPGTHTLALEYRPPGARAGLAISLLTAGVLAALVIADRRRR